MGFKILARTIFHLGAELISSDGIAFYELIKNAIDAKSEQIEIRVLIRIDHSEYLKIREKIEKDDSCELRLEQYKEKIASLIDSFQKNSKRLIKQVQQAEDAVELLNVLDWINQIKIKDTGHGMTLKDLDEIYLTIGTRSRLAQKNITNNEIILGEKGIGRLAVMRLGNLLKISTTTESETKWNRLNIDWRVFSHDSDEELSEINIKPLKGKIKRNDKTQGTTIRIGALSAPWTQDRLTEIARTEFSKLTDPFYAKRNYPIKLYFNQDRVTIPTFKSFLLKEAHAKIKAEFTKDKEGYPILRGNIDYILHGRKKTFQHTYLSLLSVTDNKAINEAPLQSLGPFSVEVYWFNRPLLKELENYSKTDLRNLLAEWTGGVMVYRDGYRVNPYGGPDDDWLGQDKKAIASGGFKMNRKQLVGKLEISKKKNPRLVDQANREGIRDCMEFEALRSLLKFLLQTEMLNFLNKVEEEKKTARPETFAVIQKRLESHKEIIDDNLKSLLGEFPKIKKTTYVKTIKQEVDLLESAITEAKAQVDAVEEGYEKVLYLAGLGMMVDVLAHELNRATGNTLDTVRGINNTDEVEKTEDLLFTLEHQLKTLKKRLQSLDPLSPAARNRKESIDLEKLIINILEAHEGQFDRHDITWSIETVNNDNKKYKIKAVKGMFIQIFENLISNSVYWLKMKSKLDDDFAPEINVIVDAGSQKVLFTDNGPGVEPERKEEIFEAFVTTKPPMEGKGLGLYISKELAQYHKMNIELLEKLGNKTGNLNTFCLSLSE